MSYASPMTKRFGSFRQLYRTALRTVTIVLVLWIMITCLVQCFFLNAPGLYR